MAYFDLKGWLEENGYHISVQGNSLLVYSHGNFITKFVRYTGGYPWVTYYGVSVTRDNIMGIIGG